MLRRQWRLGILTSKQHTPNQPKPRRVRHQNPPEGQILPRHALRLHPLIPPNPREADPEVVDKRGDGREVDEPAEDDGGALVDGHVGEGADGEDEDKRGERDAALGGVAEDARGLALAGEGVDGADGDEDEGVAAGGGGGDDDGAGERDGLIRMGRKEKPAYLMICGRTRMPRCSIPMTKGEAPTPE